MTKNLRACGLLALLIVGGCGALPITPPDSSVADRPTAHSAGHCVALLGHDRNQRSESPLDNAFELVVWNVAKATDQAWRADLDSLAANSQVVALQEFDLSEREALEGQPYFSFSEGFSTGSRTTGVATFSAAPPLAECHLRMREPWLRTVKAINVTTYDLQDRDDNLMVVNVHAINFSVGLRRYRQQIAMIDSVLTGHVGPVLLLGDFNTWRGARFNVVSTLLEEHSLEAVEMREDVRKRFAGHALDHVFTRDAAVASSRSVDLDSSDHNPIVVEVML